MQHLFVKKCGFYCQVVRVDMREMLTMAAGERAASYDGLQVRMGEALDPFVVRVPMDVKWRSRFSLISSLETGSVHFAVRAPAGEPRSYQVE